VNSYSGWKYADNRQLALSLSLIDDTEYLIGINSGLFHYEFIPKKKIT
jgi:hypothetical protein